jgi:hypothetical protein
VRQRELKRIKNKIKYIHKSHIKTNKKIDEFGEGDQRESEKWTLICNFGRLFEIGSLDVLAKGSE